MTQVIYATGIEFPMENRIKKIPAKHPFLLIDYLLIFTVILGLHAAIIYFLSTTVTTPPQIIAAQAQPVEITLTAVQPEPIVPPVVSEPPPVPETEPEPEPAPQPVDELAAIPEKPAIKPLPETKKTLPRRAPPAVPKPTKPAQAVASPSEPRIPQTASATANQTVTPPLANANYLHNPPPDYPESAIDRGQEGVVLLRVQVSPLGKAVTVQIHKSSGVNALDAAALRTVRNWSFVPAKRGNEAISGQVIVPVDFSLNS